ncbi:MAG TPA: ankyrin repeat domain-containing protein [Steroidobacteraceae bacterium]|nr:ankyrin repeat domain-containing protein [Steroidobacteraceae bacterium]
MNTPPPPFDPSDDADEQYRRASELDPSRPSEATRRAVLEHAARLAAERTRRGARRRWLPFAGVTLRWQAIVGTVAAASLAGVMIAPQFLAPVTPPAAKEALQRPAPAPAPIGSVHPGSPASSAPEPARYAPSAQRAPRRESAPAEGAPAASDSAAALQLEQRAGANAARAPALVQNVVVTGARRTAAPTVAVSAVAAVRPPPSASAQAPAGPDALREAAAAGDLVALKGALAGAGDIDGRDAQGRTALMLATLNGQADAVAELLAHGADPSGADAHGTTPLQAAVAADERDIIALLRRYGAR